MRTFRSIHITTGMFGVIWTLRHVLSVQMRTFRSLISVFESIGTLACIFIYMVGISMVVEVRTFVGSAWISVYFAINF